METETEPRYRAVHAYLSDGAHETWQDVATEYGVSVSGLIVAMGLALQLPADEQVIGPRLEGRRGRTAAPRSADRVFGDPAAGQDHGPG